MNKFSEDFQETIKMLSVWFKGHNPKVFLGREWHGERMDIIFIDGDTEEFLGRYMIKDEQFEMAREYYGTISFDFNKEFKLAEEYFSRLF
ncbi:MAG: hypothetical protein Q8933_09330 [Bacteroidota bacterium]|nr:hypothetical protein [Bacteroidota bacterium]